MKLFLRKLEVLLMASTYAQAQDRDSALQCLKTVYTERPRKGQRPEQQAKDQRQQLRL